MTAQYNLDNNTDTPLSPPTPASIRTTHVNEEARVMKVLHALSYGGVLMLCVIGVKSWLYGHTYYGFSLFLFAALVLINSLLHRRVFSDRLFKNMFLGMIALLFLYLTATGGESNTGPLWFYLFPPFVFYLTGLRSGILLSLGALICILIIFNFPQLPFVFTEYSGDFQLRFLASMGFTTFFSYVIENSRRNARNELLNMARLYEKASRTDELTQLPNRRDMQHHLEQEFHRYSRYGHHFSIILMDIDHFKKINDTYGHDAGDLVLVKFAEILRSTCRKLDLPARWGGEEFLILLPETSLLQALSLAERLRKQIERTVIHHKNQEIRITTSCGVCSISQNKDLNSLLKHADIYLYQAKLKGRNRVIPLVMQKPDED